MRVSGDGGIRWPFGSFRGLGRGHCSSRQTPLHHAGRLPACSRALTNAGGQRARRGSSVWTSAPLRARRCLMPFGTRESDFDSFTLLTGSARRAGRRSPTAEPPGCAPLSSTRSSMSSVMRPGVGPAADPSPRCGCGSPGLTNRSARTGEAAAAEHRAPRIRGLTRGRSPSGWVPGHAAPQVPHVSWSQGRTTEGGGFEPPSEVNPRNGFRDRRIRPLCHPSAGQASRGAESPSAAGRTLRSPTGRGVRAA